VWAGVKEGRMVLTPSELIGTLQQEIRVLLHLLHLAGKVEHSMLGYRPTPLSTLELLQYLAIMGPTQLTVIEHGVFDRPTLSATSRPRLMERHRCPL
jgi:hypothetical protein